jgi:Transposase DDE domain
LGDVYRLPLRQSEGFVRSLIELMKIDLIVPAHTTLSRRRRTVSVDEYRWPRKGPVDLVIDSNGLKFFGAGEWARKKHGEKRRSWRKLHISVNPDDNEIIAFELTDDDISDAAMIGDLVANSGGNIRTVIADGAPSYRVIRAARPARSPSKLSSHRANCRSPTRANRTAAVSANAMPPRSPATVEWPGSSGTVTANDLSSRPPSPASNTSTTDA